MGERQIEGSRFIGFILYKNLIITNKGVKLSLRKVFDKGGCREI